MSEVLHTYVTGIKETPPPFCRYAIDILFDLQKLVSAACRGEA